MLDYLLHRMAFFLRTKILEVLFWFVPCHASIPYDKYGWISELYNVLKIVSGRMRFSVYKSQLALQLSETFKLYDLQNLIFCQYVCPKI